MKMIMAVLVVRFIISLFEKEKNTKAVRNNTSKIIHPAEFEIR